MSDAKNTAKNEKIAIYQKPIRTNGSRPVWV